jgi:hypothetical protein
MCPLFIPALTRLKPLGKVKNVHLRALTALRRYPQPRAPASQEKPCSCRHAPAGCTCDSAYGLMGREGGEGCTSMAWMAGCRLLRCAFFICCCRGAERPAFRRGPAARHGAGARARDGCGAACGHPGRRNLSAISCHGDRAGSRRDAAASCRAFRGRPSHMAPGGTQRTGGPLCAGAGAGRRQGVDRHRRRRGRCVHGLQG